MTKKRIRYIGHAGTLRIAGLETGTPYVFAGHGSVVAVKVEDADGLLALASADRGCCGGHPQARPLFAPA